MTSITKAPAAVLRIPAKPIKIVDKKIRSIIADMDKTLITQKDPEGVGLAAPQIGLPLQIFLILPRTGSTKSAGTQVFINPQITHLSKDTISPNGKDALLEGCLSIPNYYAHVRRSKSITLKYLTLQDPKNLEGEPVEITRTFSGFPAQIIQHEFDHLNGVLFIDRVLEQNGKLYEIQGENWKEVNL